MRYLQTSRGFPEYRRAVAPRDQHKFGGKTQIWRRLKGDDPGEVAVEYARIHREFERVLKYGDSDLSTLEHAACKALADDLGIQPLPGDLKSADVLELVDITARNFGAVSNFSDDWKLRAPVLASALRASDTLDDYYEKYKLLIRDKDLKRSRREKARFHDPIKLAIKECVNVLGDVAVRTIKKADAYRFRNKLISDVEKGAITASTGNKKIMHLRKMVATVNKAHYPDLPNPFEIDVIEDDIIGVRPPFSEIEIEAIINELTQSDLNDELKAIIVIGMQTGATCKEIALLTYADIALDSDVPHIRIGANEFRVKAKHGGDRHRKIPIFGDALSWMQKFPTGFERYRRDGGGEAVSAASGKFLKRVTGKTFYSFRHRLADLLRNSKCQDQLRNAIFGHKQSEMTNHYGDGWGLQQKLKALKNAHDLGKKNLKKEQEINAKLQT